MMNSYGTNNIFPSLQQRLRAIALVNAPKHKIIVGIDYGTTFTGISHVTTDQRSITIISAWPGDPFGSWKTPTRIAYREENARISTNKWGFEVHPKLNSCSWTKLLLDKNATVGEYDDPTLRSEIDAGMFRLPSFRDAPGVCEDFLREVYLFLSQKLRQQLTDSTFERTPMESWITLPAIWSEEAKAATLTAARNAGFVRTAEDEVFTIAEPEAAAIATFKQYAEANELNPIKVNENVLICDCGGGTVDVTTYTITQVQPYLTFDELCVGVGGKCGSTRIDRNLHVLLSQRFGSAFDDLLIGVKGPGSRLMIAFEGLKQHFGAVNNSDDQEIGPVNLGLPDSELYDAEDRMVKLSHEDMKGLFDPVIADITRLVGQQVEEARRARNAEINLIILVGGFGESPYLNKALRDWCRENGGITLICSKDPQAVVVRGAALRGLTGIAPRVKHARRHYGVAVGFDFREGIDPEDYAYLDSYNENKKMCGNRMLWFISKGDEIIKGTNRNAIVYLSYEPGCRFINQIPLYSCALTEAPEYSNDFGVDRVCTIESTFNADFNFGLSSESRFSFTNNRYVCRFHYYLMVNFGDKGDNLTFKCIVNGQEEGTADVKFD